MVLLPDESGLIPDECIDRSLAARHGQRSSAAATPSLTAAADVAAVDVATYMCCNIEYRYVSESYEYVVPCMRSLRIVPVLL